MVSSPLRWLMDWRECGPGGPPTAAQLPAPRVPRRPRCLLKHSAPSPWPRAPTASDRLRGCVCSQSRLLSSISPAELSGRLGSVPQEPLAAGLPRGAGGVSPGLGRDAESSLSGGKRCGSPTVGVGLWVCYGPGAWWALAAHLLGPDPSVASQLATGWGAASPSCRWRG